MAQILPIQSQFQQQAQPQFQSQVVPSIAPDPLFEALAKFITSGPGPSSVTSSQVEEIIDSHVNQSGGREWLESIVLPPPEPQLRIWPMEGKPDGFISTNLRSMTISFSFVRNRIFQIARFTGFCQGFFPPQAFILPEKSLFHFEDVSDNLEVRVEVDLLVNVSILTIKFYKGDNPNAIAELLVPDATLRLPSYTIKGTGKFKFLEGPQ